MKVQRKKRRSGVVDQKTAEWLIYNDLDLIENMDMIYPVGQRDDTMSKKLELVIKKYVDKDEEVYRFPDTHRYARYAITSKGKMLTGGHITNILGLATNNKDFFFFSRGRRDILRDLMEDGGFTYDHEVVLETIKKYDLKVTRTPHQVGYPEIDIMKEDPYHIL